MKKTKVQINSLIELTNSYPNQFDRIGHFKSDYHIVLKPDHHPMIHAPRKCPIHLRDDIEEELKTIESQGIIRKVSEPPEWVSSIVYIRKKIGKLRLCLDPKDLNRTIMRCHYKTPTMEELAHKLSGAQHFSKLDAKNGYWSILLDAESQLLTIFHSPFGRFCFRRIPFGLVMSQDVFMHRMDMILEKCPGIIGLIDDVIFYGKTKEEHDSNLHNLMRIARTEGLCFNSEKCVTDQKRNLDMVLLCLQSTPIDHVIASPDELLINQKLLGNLPVKCLNNATQKEKIATRLYQRQSYQKSQHDQNIQDLPNIREGQRVWVCNPDSSKWSPAVVTQRCVEPRSYIVQTSSGKSLCRNRKHLRED